VGNQGADVRVVTFIAHFDETDVVRHSAFRIEVGAAKILIDPFLSDNPSWDKGWIGSHAGEDSTRGGGR
jgi:hypothetical protein